MASQLGVYNQALALIDGQRQLATVSDNEEPRRVLDLHYAAAIAQCLEAGVWNFAIRSSQETYDATVSAGGYTYSFNKPTDWVRTAQVSLDSQFAIPFNDYRDEAGVIRASVSTLYLKYVSNHATLGGGLLTAWPQSFTDYVVANLALRACPRLAPSEPVLERLTKWERKKKNEALARDAMNDPPGIMPRGSWSRSRGGNWRNDQRRDNS